MLALAVFAGCSAAGSVEGYEENLRTGIELCQSRHADARKRENCEEKMRGKMESMRAIYVERRLEKDKKLCRENRDCLASKQKLYFSAVLAHQLESPED